MACTHATKELKWDTWKKMQPSYQRQSKEFGFVEESDASPKHKAHRYLIPFYEGTYRLQWNSIWVLFYEGNGCWHFYQGSI
jgi:hypothetical protein